VLYKSFVLMFVQCSRAVKTVNEYKVLFTSFNSVKNVFSRVKTTTNYFTLYCVPWSNDNS